MADQEVREKLTAADRLTRLENVVEQLVYVAAALEAPQGQQVYWRIPQSAELAKRLRARQAILDALDNLNRFLNK